MKAIIAAVIVALSLSACGQADRTMATLTGVSKSCVDGVVYLQFTSGASVQYDQNGKVVTCK